MIILIIIFIIIFVTFFFVKKPSEKSYNPSDALVGDRKREPLSNPKHLENKISSSTTTIALKSNLNEYSYRVVGSSNYQQALGRIANGKNTKSVEIKTQAVLKLEPSNPYDSNAVAVYVSSSKVGYLPRDDAFDFTAWVRRKGLHAKVNNFQVDAIILGGWKRNGSEGSFGVALNLPDDFDDLKTY